MHAPGTYRIVAAAVGVVLVGAWVAWLMDLELGSSSVGDVRLVGPGPTWRHHARAGSNVRFFAEGARDCEARGDGTGRVSAGGQLNRLVPLQETEFGERLVWLSFDCPDGSTGFARVVNVSNPVVPTSRNRMVEVARVGLDFRRAETWLEGFLAQVIRSKAVEYDVFEVGKPRVKLDVSDGFDVQIDLPLNIRPDWEAGWATVRWGLKVVAVENSWIAKQPVKLVFEWQSRHFDTGSVVVNAAFWLFGLESQINNELLKPIEAEIGRQANEFVGELLEWLREKAPEKFLEFLLSESETVKRVLASGAIPNRFELAPPIVGRKGGTLHFSLMAPLAWMGERVPELEATDTGESVSVSVSYAFINRLVGVVVDDRELNDVLKELRSMLVLSGAIGGRTFDEAAGDVTGLGKTLEEFFEFAELSFDDSLSFKLRVRVRPVSATETRVFFANAEVLMVDPAPAHGDRQHAPRSGVGDTETRDLAGVPIGLSAEGRVDFERLPNEGDMRFLLDHIAFEPLVGDGRRPLGLDRYYALTPLFRRLVRWERAGELEREPLGQGVEEFRSNVMSIIRAASMREYAPVEFEVYADDHGVTVGSVDVSRNDVGRNALVVEGTLGYSKAGAVFVTKDLFRAGVSWDHENAQKAKNAARRECEADGNSCQISMVFFRAVVALAKSHDRERYFAKGPNAEVARALAMDRCRRAGGRPCRVEKGNLWRNEG